jgi:hypothetical protein
VEKWFQPTQTTIPDDVTMAEAFQKVKIIEKIYD